MKIEMIGLTDTGVVREHNEDDFVLRPEDYVAVLADGMGGHQAGEVASQLAVDVIAENVTQRLQEVGTRESAKQRREALRAATLQANADILQTGIDRPECLGMGATVVAVTF
ncbi:MAG: protein phosphatase 2C domain-containing protein, partial [Gammaproteobacteria bacterium]|nr:protein phosphatase 2C domain-containing protein [Gammaproteobacteria bacterium]